MTNVDLIEKKDIREQMIGRVEVLDKVKALFLIPEIEVMTTKMVADYFDVESETINKCYQRNKVEIDFDGVKLVKNINEFLDGHNVQARITQLNGKKELEFITGLKIVIPNVNIRLFSKRAVLRTAMLLRDSKIAQEVRTQLLNTFEHSTEQQRTTDIDEENQLALNIGLATISGDAQKVTVACAEYIAFKDRHIAKLEKANKNLENVNELLTRKTMEWGDRAILNALVRSYATRCLDGNFTYGWNILYKNIRYKHGINVHTRGGKGILIDKIKTDEYPKVIATAVTMCEDKGIDIANVINTVNEINSKLA